MKPHRLLPSLLLTVWVLTGASGADEKTRPPPGPGKPYRPAEELGGTLRIVGSRTLAHVAALWSEGFRRYHPKVVIDIQCEGTETASPEPKPAEETLWALSRELSADEVKKLESEGKQKLFPVCACEDLVAVIVHKDNPVRALSMAQLRELFGRDDAKGAPEKVTWGAVGLTGDWAGLAVSPQTRDATSGTRTYFRQRVLGEGGKERPGKEHTTFRGVLEAVAKERGAVGFCRWVGDNPDLKVVPLQATADDAPVAPSRDPVAAAKYPLLRRLSLVAAAPPEKKLSDLRREFLLYVLSRNGQEDAVKDGFIALDRAGLLEGLDHLGFNQTK
jgi:phosphate transport system substrate-binding protein